MERKTEAGKSTFSLKMKKSTTREDIMERARLVPLAPKCCNKSCGRSGDGRQKPKESSRRIEPADGGGGGGGGDAGLDADGITDGFWEGCHHLCLQEPADATGGLGVRAEGGRGVSDRSGRGLFG